MAEESSFGLVRRVKAGDVSALNRLMARYLPRLRRWTRRRLPPWARDLAETEDLVQDTLLNAVRNLPQFEMRHDLSLQAYMKRAARNRLNDEIKRARRHLPPEALGTDVAGRQPTPEQSAISREDLWRCRVALARLRPKDRRLILVAMAADRTRDRWTNATGQSAEATRVALSRALDRLAQEMERLTL